MVNNVDQSIPSLYPEIEERATPPGKGAHAYFRRLRDGWIAPHIAHPAAVQDMNFKGWVMMPQFGTWTMPGPGRNSTVRDLRGIPFNPTEEQWRLILQAPGGAEAFTVEQILAYRWHIRPPYREVTFPQLEGVETFDLFCPECEKGIFSSPNKQIATDLLRQHLISRVNDAHSYRPEDLRALGSEYDIDFFAERTARRRSPVRVEPEESLESEPLITEMTQTSDNVLVCKDCGEEFSGPKAKTDRMQHGKKCPAKLAATV